MALHERHLVRLPDHPVLVIALEGWIDAGFAAAAAIGTLLEAIPAEALATFSGEELIDYRARRPRLRIDDGVRGEIAFTEPRLLVGADRLGAGVAMLVGPEPDFRWKAFAGEVAELAVELGTRLVVGLGAFPAAVPHTRPIRLAATASSEELARRVGFVPGSIDVPSGIGEVIGEACTKAGIPSVGLWARVPHYVAGMPYTPAGLALVEGFCALTGVVVDTDELRRAAEAGRRRVDELIAASEEHAGLVHRLEEQLDALGEEAGMPDGTGLSSGYLAPGGLHGEDGLPSGEEIAAELERFLRGET